MTARLTFSSKNSDVLLASLFRFERIDYCFKISEGHGPLSVTGFSMNSGRQSPSWEARSRLSGKQISRFLRTGNFIIVFKGAAISRSHEDVILKLPSK